MDGQSALDAARGGKSLVDFTPVSHELCMRGDVEMTGKPKNPIEDLADSLHSPQQMADDGGVEAAESFANIEPDGGGASFANINPVDE
jgi:hypothetical protein